jgi:Domain of unknown function (DUF4062)
MATVPKAMLSSTSLDLPKYRAAARDACLAAGTFPIMMEHLPASDADAVQASLRMADEADIYVGILAHRYGYVPQGADRSITQMEYERAAERGIPRLMFLIHKDTPVLIDDVETGPAAEKLKAFKDRVSRDRVVHFFRSEDDLRAGLIQALGELHARRGATAPAAGAGGSDLNVSSLRGARRLSPLSGHPVLEAAAYPMPVHTGGVHVSFTLAHNGQGQQSINVHALVLEVVRYEPGPIAGLAYQIEGEEVQGAGVARPHVFQVTLAGMRIEPARWVVDSVRGTVLRALSENFFHTPKPRILTFPAGSPDIEEIQGTVLAAETGLYELRFAFCYSVAGVDREHRSEPILIYSDE